MGLVERGKGEEELGDQLLGRIARVEVDLDRGSVPHFKDAARGSSAGRETDTAGRMDVMNDGSLGEPLRLAVGPEGAKRPGLRGIDGVVNLGEGNVVES